MGHYSTADIVTADGRYLAGTDWDTGKLLVRDLTTREERRPVRGRRTAGGLLDFAEDPAFSPDMSQIAYSWFADDGSGRAANSVRVVPTKSAGVPRTIASLDRGSGYFSVVGWSPDGQSPDGRWIAYSTWAAKGSSDHPVYVLGAGGSGPNRLTTTAGMSVGPVWTTDGRKVLFVSNWSGSFGLWSVPVGDGQPGGPPVLVKADMGQIDAIDVTATGSYYYNYRYDSGSRTIVTRASGSQGRMPVPERVTADFAGGLAAWSPDGTRVAFIRQQTSGGRTINELGVRVTATGEERVFSSHAVAAQRPICFHSRQALLVFASGDVHSARRRRYPCRDGARLPDSAADSGRAAQHREVRASQRRSRKPRPESGWNVAAVEAVS